MMKATEPAASGGTQPPVDTAEPEYLTSKEVAAWLRVSAATLCRWRQTGHGPRVTWLTPACPRYRRGDVEAWLKRAAA